MRFGLYRTQKRRPGNAHGEVPAEFELRSQRFFLLSLGIIDSDCLWYMRDVVSDPSQGVDRTNRRILSKNLIASIANTPLIPWLPWRQPWQ
jgi:hypothetical protein